MFKKLLFHLWIQLNFKTIISRISPLRSKRWLMANVCPTARGAPVNANSSTFSSHFRQTIFLLHCSVLLQKPPFPLCMLLWQLKSISLPQKINIAGSQLHIRWKSFKIKNHFKFNFNEQASDNNMIPITPYYLNIRVKRDILHSNYEIIITPRILDQNFIELACSINQCNWNL